MEYATDFKASKLTDIWKLRIPDFMVKVSLLGIASFYNSLGPKFKCEKVGEVYHFRSAEHSKCLSYLSFANFPKEFLLQLNLFW